MKCFHNFSPPDSPLFFDIKGTQSFFQSTSSIPSKKFVNGIGSGIHFQASSQSRMCKTCSKDEDTSSLYSQTDEPIHILNVSISTEKGVDDQTLSKQFLEFVRSKKVSQILDGKDLNFL